MPISMDLRINGRSIAAVTIRNDGTGDENVGNYDVMLLPSAVRGLDVPVPDRVARVEGFDRSRGAVVLLHEALGALLA